MTPQIYFAPCVILLYITLLKVILMNVRAQAVCTVETGKISKSFFNILIVLHQKNFTDVAKSFF
jgi:hypothetical protein